MLVSYENLRVIMAKRNITRQDIHEGTGLSNDVLKKIRTDDNMGVETISKIAIFLGVEIGDIVTLKKSTSK